MARRYNVFIGIYETEDGKKHGGIYNGRFGGWDQWHRETFREHEQETAVIIPLSVSGRTYQERKADAQEAAVIWSNNNDFDLSWGEFAAITSHFETIGKRYGLLEEFRENAII